jgi:hypothetical protein
MAQTGSGYRRILSGAGAVRLCCRRGPLSHPLDSKRPRQRAGLRPRAVGSVVHPASRSEWPDAGRPRMTSPAITAERRTAAGRCRHRRASCCSARRATGLQVRKLPARGTGSCVRAGRVDADVVRAGPERAEDAEATVIGARGLVAGDVRPRRRARRRRRTRWYRAHSDDTSGREHRDAQQSTPHSCLPHRVMAARTDALRA